MKIADLNLDIRDLREPLRREDLIMLLELACDEMESINAMFAQIRKAGEARLAAA